MSSHSRPSVRLMTGCVLLCATLSVQADEDVQWNGFLNVVGGFSRYETANLQEPEGTFTNGFGYDQDFTFDHETSAGLQASKALDEQTEVTTQIFARGSDENYQARMKWLYLTWQPDEYSRFRIGHVGTPTYYFSDYLNVGYAYHWITPPQWVYMFDTSVTGIDYTFEDTWDDLAWSVELAAGTQDDYLAPSETDYQSTGGRGIVMSVSKGEWLSARVANFLGDSSFQFRNQSPEGIIDKGFAAVVDSGALSQSQADLLQGSLSAGITSYIDEVLLIEEEPLEYRSFALRIDQPAWFAMYETTRLITDSYLLSSSRAWFLTAGIRTGSVVWHLTRTEFNVPLQDDAKRDEAIVTAGPSGADPAVLTDYFGRAFRLGVAYGYASDFRDWTLGSTIEMSANTLLKFEATYMEQFPMGELDTAGIGYNTLFKAAVNVSF